jgi:hypothetical protein
MGRKRIPDQKSVGASKSVPYLPHESAADRHRRRLFAAIGESGRVDEWCKRYGCFLTISNDGHHWTIETPSFEAEWWPSSGKLVFDREYQRGIHTHDVQQLLAQLNRRIGP